MNDPSYEMTIYLEGKRKSKEAAAWPAMPHLQPAQTTLARIGVEPPIAAQDKVRRKLRDLKIEEAELTELLATNRALQLQYESQLVPF